ANIVFSREQMNAFGASRIRAAQQRCLLIEPVLTTWRPTPIGLGATAAAALVTTRQAVHDTAEPLLPPPPLAMTPIDPEARWRALDARDDPGLCVPPGEAWPLVRTCEPPSDERSPFACGRGRFHSVRTQPTRGVVLGDAMHRGVHVPVHLPDED